jgi:L-aspartate oxidase
MKPPIVVIGSGIAGLTFALKVSEFRDVVVLTKSKIDEGSTKYAQGGIAAVVSNEDDFEAHVADTMKAGSYHNDEEMVRFMVENGPKAIEWLKSCGANFDAELALEGGHSKRRVMHNADRTGAEIEDKLIYEIGNKDRRIEVLEEAFAVDLEVRDSRVVGVHYLKDGEFKFLYSSDVVIATGGIGQLYKFTSNPAVSTGDGVALAYRAGAEVKDMEFVQFHPTVLASGDLISEAVRGEGAKLVNSKGERFVNELDARDKVSLAIYEELKNGQVYLDIRDKDKEYLIERFPNIYKVLEGMDIDMSEDLIPVQPAAHYLCGGIKIDKNGRTNVEGLYAFGECAYTGVHGANRLASNSLLEAAVFAMQIGEEVKGEDDGTGESNRNVDLEGFKSVKADKAMLQSMMWDKVGVVRNKQDLGSAFEELSADVPITADVSALEYRNMILVGRLICEAALKREESLGCHVVR